MTPDPTNPLHNSTPTITFKNNNSKLPEIMGEFEETTKELATHISPAEQIKNHFTNLLEDVQNFAPEYSSQTYRFTERELKLLSKAFVNDHTEEFACLFAGITRKYFKTVVAANPEIKSFFDDLRKVPEAMAQETVISGLSGEKAATWFLENRASEKYNKKTVIEASTGLGEALDKLESENNSPHVVSEQ